MAIPITPTGRGTPDWTSINALAKTVYGLFLEYGESWVWPYLMCFTGGAAEPLAGNREPLAVGETANLIEAFSGLNVLRCAAGEDYLLKAVFIGFDQPVLYEQIQVTLWGLAHTCWVVYPAQTPQPYSPWYIGWSRSLLEDITVGSDTILRITNLGAAATSGKAWIIGKKKTAQYEEL